MGFYQTVENVNKAYVGFEITFSNNELECMRLTDKEFKLNKSNKISYTEYCKKIHKEYHQEWKKYAVKTKINGFTLKDVECVKSKRKETKKEDYMMLKFQYVINKYVDKYDKNTDIVRTENELIQWTWYLDVDECCLEVHAPPLTIDEYETVGVREIIEKHIFNIAKEKLKLKSGKGGMGGGHLSVDMVTGFDNKPESVLKTVLLWEVLKSKIDECGESIDVEDNVNAGYFYDGTRGVLPGKLKVKSIEDCKLELTVPGIIDWLRGIRPKSTKNLKKPNDILSKIFCKTIFHDKNNEAFNDIDKDSWNNFVIELATFARDHPIDVHKDKMPSDEDEDKKEDEDEKEDKKNFSKAILHYHNINLEHVHICDSKKNGLHSDSRVEFRRFVSQKDYYVLLKNIQFLLALIAYARIINFKEFIRLFYSIPNFVLDRTV